MFSNVLSLMCEKGELKALCQEYQTRICDVESSKYDLEKEVEFKDYHVSKMNTENILHSFRTCFLAVQELFLAILLCYINNYRSTN